MSSDNTDLKIKIAIVMGSKSDWPVMQEATVILDELKLDYHVQVVSAHRTPELLSQFATQAQTNGFQVIIAGAGGAAHLPGMLAAQTPLPVLGVPIKSKALNGIDSLLSIVQMPKGVAVATLAIDSPGAYNAGLMAAQILALNDAELAVRLTKFRDNQTQNVLASPDPRQS